VVGVKPDLKDCLVQFKNTCIPVPETKTLAGADACRPLISVSNLMTTRPDKAIPLVYLFDDLLILILKL
jgi:hypothetical protein